MKTTYDVEFYSDRSKDWLWLEDRKTLKAAARSIESEKRKDAKLEKFYKYRVIERTERTVSESELRAAK